MVCLITEMKPLLKLAKAGVAVLVEADDLAVKDRRLAQ